MMKMTFNGKRITSSSQLKREMTKSFAMAIDKKVRSSAPPGVRVTKTSSGYKAEGSAEAIQKMTKRLAD